MKNQIKLAALLLLSTINHQLSTGFAQGSLTPPDAPAPTMKSLDQIYAKLDARIPITNTDSLVTISQPGSYYLTGNLTVSTGDGIDITANGVTLDLNGYTISSTADSATGTAISLGSNLKNITIANGFIQGGVTNNGSGVYSGPGFAYVIMHSNFPPVNVLVSRVSVAGFLYGGIDINLSYSTVVESCTVQTVGGIGIFASTVRQSTALDCFNGIEGKEVSDSSGVSSGIGTGVLAFTAQNCRGECGTSGNGLIATTAQNCIGSSSTGYGVSADNAQNCRGFCYSGTGLYASASAENCYGASTTGNGLTATTALNCFGKSTSGYGIFASTAQNCYSSSDSGTGLSAFIANACHGISTTGMAMSLTHNANSF